MIIFQLKITLFSYISKVLISKFFFNWSEQNFITKKTLKPALNII